MLNRLLGGLFQYAHGRAFSDSREYEQFSRFSAESNASAAEYGDLDQALAHLLEMYKTGQYVEEGQEEIQTIQIGAAWPCASHNDHDPGISAESESSRTNQQKGNAAAWEKSRRAALFYLIAWELTQDPVLAGTGKRRRFRSVAGTEVNLFETTYSASMILPMITVSSGGMPSYVALATQMLGLCILCFGVQLYIIGMLVKATETLPSINGQPNMCTYGQYPDLAGKAYGPSGSVLKQTRSNVETDFTLFMIRNTLAEVLKHVPVNNTGIGPVEYGMEDAACRTVCISLFVLSLAQQAYSAYQLFVYLWRTPSYWICSALPETAVWVSFHVQPSEVETKGKPHNYLENVSFHAEGMPWLWKFLYCFPVLGIRLILLARIGLEGVAMLMNTGAITTLIMDCVALTFITELDSLVFTAFATGMCKDILSRLETFKAKKRRKVIMDEVERIEQREMVNGCSCVISSLSRSFHASLMTIAVGTLIFFCHYQYFFGYCVMDQPPFKFSKVFEGQYFDHNFRISGSLNFIFGRWSSTNIVDPDGSETCRPFRKGTADKGATGCGLPDPWFPSD